MKSLEMNEKKQGISRDMLTKVFISQLLIVLKYQTSYQSTKTMYSHLIFRYEKNLISIVINYNNFFRNN